MFNWNWYHLSELESDTAHLVSLRIARSKTYVCQQSCIICATDGSTSSGISRRLFWKPTAPTTCIGFNPFQGIRKVDNSHNITPKLYTSHLQTRQPDYTQNLWHCKVPIYTCQPPAIEQSTSTHMWTYFSLARSFLRTSGAIHSGCRMKEAFIIIFLSSDKVSNIMQKFGRERGIIESFDGKWVSPFQQ